MKLKRRNKRYDGVDMYDLDSLVTPQDYIMALSSYRNKKAFFSEINAMIDQINGFMKRQNTLIMILYQNFNNDDHLASVIQILNDSEHVLYSNARGALGDMSTFDEKEYEKIGEKRECTKKEEEKQQRMEGQIQRVENLRKQNEAILSEVGKLLAQIARMAAGEETNDLSKLKACIN